MIIYFTLLVALIGVGMFVLCSKPQLVEIGKIMFWTGLLAFLLQASNAHLGIISR